jgi:uncharacterized membrane protein
MIYLREIIVTTLTVLITLGFLVLAAMLVRALARGIESVTIGIFKILFLALVLPPIWLWHKARKPMWKTYSRQQTNELEAWLRRGRAR